MRLADLKGRSVAVWGTGRDGRAAVRAIARQQPSRLIAVDDSAGFASIPWDAAFAPLAGGDHAFPALVTADVVVRSPEVPPAHPWLREIRTRGIPVTDGSALWMADHAARTIGVTGSKTTAALISHLLAAAGQPNTLGGPPLLDLPEASQYVLALPADQCTDLTASPRVAVVTAPAGEDVDAYGLNLLRHDPEMIVVDGADLRLRDEIRGLTDANRFPPVPAGADDSRFRIDGETVYCSDEPLFPRSALRLDGAHHGRNLCVALAVLDGIGVDVPGRKSELAAAVAAFESPPPRPTEDPSGTTFIDGTR